MHVVIGIVIGHTSLIGRKVRAVTYAVVCVILGSGNQPWEGLHWIYISLAPLLMEVECLSAGPCDRDHHHCMRCIGMKPWMKHTM